MTTQEDYVERLEKIIDKQDDLLSQFDAKFKQQDTINEALSKHNNFLKEDIQKHKTLTKDMNKTIIQQKNVVAKLKKELEDQLKIQQDLHKEYGEVIKQLTDDLDEEQQKNDNLIKKQEELESEIKKLNETISSQTNNTTGNNYYDSLNQKSDDSNPSTTSQNQNKIYCPKCGSEVKEGFLFCDSCGTKL